MFFFEKLRKNCKICDENLLKFSGRSGAKEFSFRLVSAWFFPVVFYLTDSKGAKDTNLVELKKILQNAPSLAIVPVDTDENEPPKVRQLDN